MNQIRVEPALSAPASAAAPPSHGSHVAPDSAPSPNLMGGDEAVMQLAEMLAHAGTQTPLTVGLLGGPGSGKSFVLSRLLRRLDALTSAARDAARTPFTATLATIRLSAANLTGNPVTALASSIYDQLSAGSAGAAGADLARDAVHASSDPQAAARDAANLLDEARRRRDLERRSLADLDGRRARLIESVLYEAAGSRIDAHARSNRTRIEPRLRAFGFSGEPVQTYKDLVRDYSEQGGVFGRTATFLRTLWAFEGQTSLIVWAILLFLVAWGLGFAADTRASWIPSLRNSAEAMVPVANWIDGHINWLATLRSGALALAVLCLVTNVWRALRFIAPINRGASLLRADIDSRRNELDGQMVHQTRRVDTLNGEVEAQSKRLAEAERRARDTGTATVPGTRELPFLKGNDDGERQAQSFIGALTRGLQSPTPALSRLVVAIDDLELVSPQTAVDLVETAQRVLSDPNTILVVSADPAHLAGAWGSSAVTSTRLERLIQIPLCIEAGTDSEGLRRFAHALLAPPQETSATALDATQSRLDEPLSQQEIELIAGLAPLAGGSPRAVKRFVSIYRLARLRTPERPALALMLALDLGGTSGELAALGAAMDEHAPDSEIFIHPGEPRLSDAMQIVAGVQGRTLTVGAAQAAWQIARDYRIPL